MTKRKREDDDDILDEILNWYYDQFEQQQQQTGEDISDDQLNQHYDQLDQQKLDALHISLPISQQSGGGPVFEFEFKKSSLPQRWKIPHLNGGSKLPLNNHAYHLKAITLEKKLLML